MAINKQTLQTRALTALIFVIIMLAGLFTNELAFVALCTIISLGCVYEFNKIIRKTNYAFHPLLRVLVTLFVLLPVLLLVDLGINGNNYVHHIASEYFYGIYTPLLPCAILFSLWINDTMAYLVGSAIGKTPFSKISPKKHGRALLAAGSFVF